jgi:RHS repeat-associated protein
MLIRDLQGNVSMFLPLGSSSERYRYSAFGEENVSEALCPWRFSSKRTDETHLVYYGRRYYSPLHGRWLTPDPQGLSAGINLYAFLSNDPLIKLDLYGLIETRWNSFLKDNPEMRQRSVGLVHGAKDYTIDAGILLANAGYCLSVPFRAPLWAMGIGSFSRDWRGFQASNEAFRYASDRWMQRVLPADMNSSAYHSARGFSRNALDTGSMALGGVGLVKGAMSLGRMGFTSARAAFGAGQIQQSLKLYSRELKESERVASYSTKFSRPATSSMSGHLLKNKFIAEEISGGHAFSKHVVKQNEFPGFTRNQFEEHLRNILNNPTEMKSLARNRTGWDQKSGTLIIRDLIILMVERPLDLN